MCFSGLLMGFSGLFVMNVNGYIKKNARRDAFPTGIFCSFCDRF